MILLALLQRVHRAEVRVQQDTIAEIAQGLLVLVGVEQGDREGEADRLLQRVLAYRVFVDHDDKMNLSVRDIDGGLLLVPQFTLAADTRAGLRPSFSPAAAPEHGHALFQYLVAKAGEIYSKVASGCFGEHMDVSLINDGPANFLLRVPVGRPALW